MTYQPSITKYDENTFSVKLDRKDLYRLYCAMGAFSNSPGIFSTQFFNELKEFFNDREKRASDVVTEDDDEINGLELADEAQEAVDTMVIPPEPDE